MENASKALIMAGGVLIAILIISLGIGLASMMQEHSKSYYKTLSTQEITKINSEITKDFVQPFVNNAPADLNTYVTTQGILTLRALTLKLKEQGINIDLSWGTVELFDPSDSTKYGDSDAEILHDNSLTSGKVNYYQVWKMEDTNDDQIIDNIVILNTSKNK